MQHYRAKTPIYLLSSQRNDRFGFRTSWGVRVDAELVWRGLGCRLTSDAEGKMHAHFGEVPAASGDDAYAQVCEALRGLLPLVSLEIQREHVDRHYGPLRATWSRADIVISPSDEWPATSIAVRSERTVALTRINNDLAVLAASPELRPLLLSYDRALAPDDDETRFFNAFSIVEFVEGRFATRRRFAALLDDAGAAAVSHAAQACARERGVAAASVQRIGDLVGGPLHRATAEGREAKLVAILREDFGITSIGDATASLDVNLEFVRRTTSARNRLFHGAAGHDAAGFARLTDHLTLLVEQVLRAFLERRVAVPPPSS